MHVPPKIIPRFRKRIKKWFKLIPGVEKLVASALTGLRAIFGLLRPILASLQGALTRDKNNKFFGSGVKLGLNDPRSPKKPSKNILNTSPWS